MQSVSLADACSLLNLSLPLSETVVRQRFRQLAKTFHPDVATGSRQEFRQLLLAYQTLLYHCAMTQPINRPQVAASAAPVTSTDVTVVLSEEQARKGGKHTLTLDWAEICHRCQNKVSQKAGCKQCAGTGQKPMQRKVSVKLPVNLQSGMQLRLSKQGIPQKGQPSDLLITLKVDKPVISINPLKLPDSTITLTVWEALLGGEKVINTPEGQVKWSIPAGIQPNTVIQLKGKGSPKGNHWPVTVIVNIPAELSQECKHLIKQCEKACF